MIGRSRRQQVGTSSMMVPKQEISTNRNENSGAYTLPAISPNTNMGVKLHFVHNTSPTVESDYSENYDDVPTQSQDGIGSPRKGRAL